MGGHALYPFFETETDLEATRLQVGDIIAYDPQQGFRIERNGKPLWFEIPRTEERLQCFKPPWMYSTMDAAANIIARHDGLWSRCILQGYTPPAGFTGTDAWGVVAPPD